MHIRYVCVRSYTIKTVLINANCNIFFASNVSLFVRVAITNIFCQCSFQWNSPMFSIDKILHYVAATYNYIQSLYSYFIFYEDSYLICIPYSTKRWQGKNFGEFGECGVINQSFTQPNLYHKTTGRQKIHHNE